MENQRDSRAPRFKSLDGAVSPLNVLNFGGGRRYNSFLDPYASDSSDSPSPLMKYLRSADSKATAASMPAFITPVKVEEDVIVMDGIPVPKSNKGGGEVRIRSPLTPYNSIIGSSAGGRNSTSSPSAGSGVRGSGIENSKYHKNRLCRFWETNNGICQFGSDCQFAHGKEELRATRSSAKKGIKPEILKLNTISLEGSNSPSYGQVKAEESTVRLPSEPTGMALLSKSPLHLKQPPSATTTYWSPQDDGIGVNLPCHENPTKEDVDAYIEKVLYGTNSRKRLPAFAEICPD